MFHVEQCRIWDVGCRMWDVARWCKTDIRHPPSPIRVRRPRCGVVRQA